MRIILLAFILYTIGISTFADTIATKVANAIHAQNIPSIIQGIVQ